MLNFSDPLSILPAVSSPIDGIVPNDTNDRNDCMKSMILPIV